MKIIAALCFGLSVSIALAGSPIDERVDAKPTGEVEISNVSGSIRVTGWDQDQVEVTGELGEGTQRLDVIQEGSRTLVKVVMPDKGRGVEGTDLMVNIPQGSGLVVTAVSADISVENVRGPQRLQTVSGDLSTEPWQDCEAKTVSGDVAVMSRGDDGMLTLTAVSGDMLIQGVSSELTASTVSGDLEVAVTGLSRARLRTTNGDIEVEAEFAAASRFDAETINGDVELLVNGDADLDVDVETFNGSIDSCLDFDVVRKSTYGPGRELRFDTGNGERKIRVNTLNGDVEICGR